MASLGTWLQFVSKFWSEFCDLLGAIVSFSSGFHTRVTVRQREPTNTLNVCCDVWSLRIRPLGVSSSHGLSTHITHYQCVPWACLRLSVVLGTSHLFFPVWNLKLRFPLLTHLSRGVDEPGIGPDRPSSSWGRAPRPRLITTGQGLRSISSVKKCGFHLRTFLSVPFVINLLLN